MDEEVRGGVGVRTGQGGRVWDEGQEGMGGWVQERVQMCKAVVPSHFTKRVPFDHTPQTFEKYGPLKYLY